MTLYKFAYRNITRDSKTYLFHFLSCIFSVFIFYLFTALALHPALKVVDSHSTIAIVLVVGNLLSMLFSFVLVLYSISSFLKNRSKDFAILNIIGCNKKQFKRLIFLENGILSLLALFVGILLGIVFSKFFLLLAQKSIAALDLYFYVSIEAIAITLLCMGLLFLLIAILAPRILRKKKIISLLKKEEEAEKNYTLPILFALLLTLIPTLYMSYTEQYSMLLYPLLLLCSITGAYVLLSLVSTLYQWFMKKINRLFQNHNLVKITNFKYKLHTNLKTMVGTLLLFCIVLSSFIYILGSPSNALEDTKLIMPYAYMYASWDNTIDASKKVELLSNALSQEEGLARLEIPYVQLPAEWRTTRHILLSNSTYKQLAAFLHRDTLQLADNEYYLLGSDGKAIPQIPEKVKELLLLHGIDQEKGKDKNTIALSGYFSSIAVVSDTQYNLLAKDLVHASFYAFDIADFRANNVDIEDLQQAIDFTEGEETLISAYHHYYLNEVLIRGLVSYVGSILSISFLIGIASILYLRLYSMVEEESKKYRIMVQLGLSKEGLKSILASTLHWIFLLPFGIALVLSWIFILLLDRYMLSSYFSLAGICSAVYLLIESILYFLIKRKYQEKILSKVYPA